MKKQTAFRIGDHVRVIESEDTDVQTRRHLGEVGIITEIVKDCCMIEELDNKCFADTELELIPKTLENLKVGDIITDGQYFRRILARLGGEGRLTTYAVSKRGINIDGYSQNEAEGIYTVFELEEDKYTPYTPEPEKTDREKLVEEYAEKIRSCFGVSEKRVEDVLQDFADKLLK